MKLRSKYFLLDILIFCAAVAISTCVVVVSQAYAQSYRYIDESGNIYWVDSISQIPYRYREQVLGEPTPEPNVRGRNSRLQPHPTRTPKPTLTPKPTRTTLIPRSTAMLPQPRQMLINRMVPGYVPPNQVQQQGYPPQYQQNQQGYIQGNGNVVPYTEMLPPAVAVTAFPQPQQLPMNNGEQPQIPSDEDHGAVSQPMPQYLDVMPQGHEQPLVPEQPEDQTQ